MPSQRPASNSASRITLVGVAHAWATGCGKRLRARPWLLLLPTLLALAALLYVKFALAPTYTVNSTADTRDSRGASERVPRHVEARHTVCKNPGANAPQHAC